MNTAELTRLTPATEQEMHPAMAASLAARLAAGRTPLVAAGPSPAGLVLRWYTGGHMLRLGAWTLEASARGTLVCPGAYVEDIPAEWFAGAVRASRLLRAGLVAEALAMVNCPHRGEAVVPAPRGPEAA